MEGFATVKSVLSGDTVVLLGNAKPGTRPAELQLSLASLNAPRVSRHPKGEDEDFGFAAREFLRTLVVGKTVKFKVEYKNDRGRQFGGLWLHQPAAGEPTENLCVAVAAAGFATVVPEGASKYGVSQDYDAVTAAAAAAQAAGLGLHATDAAVRAAAGRRTLTWKPADPAALAASLKGTTQTGIVEQVRDGACLRVYLPSTGDMITVLLAGAACPRVQFTPGGGAAAAAPPAAAAAAPAEGSAAAKVASGGGSGAPGAQPPFALEAQFFTERRLLHRDVTLTCGGGDKFGNVIAKVTVPQGDIGLELLKAGLARVAAWSLSFTTPQHAAALTGAESGAKASKLRLWAGYEAPKIAGAKRWSGTVTEVVSGDCLMVKPDGGAPVKLFLASVRAPRVGGRGGGGDPWGPAAKEWLRKAAIGRPVAVVVDYSRAPPADAARQEHRLHASVTATSRKGAPLNLGEELLKAGLGELARHRSDDPRASCYEALLLAEAAASEAKRGVHSGRKPPGRPPFDMASAPATEAKEYLPFLQRAGRMPAVVDYVFSGHRFKVTAPGEKVTMIFAISGIRAPQAPRPGQPAAPLPTAGAAAAGGDAPASGAGGGGGSGGGGGGRAAEPWGAEARDFAFASLMQREVSITVETVDRNGGALGHLWIGAGAGAQLWAPQLLSLGFAKVIPAAAERSEHGDELFAAEAAAKAGRKGLWYAHDPEAAKKAAAAAAMEGSGGVADTFVGITVCDVSSGDSFAAHADSDASKLGAVTDALAAMKTAHGAQGAPLPSGLKRGSMVAALFDEGEGPVWFRARIDDPTPDVEGRYGVTFLDFGNAATVGVRDMRPLDNVPALISTPPLARAFRLAYVRAPGLDSEHGTASGMALSEAVMGRKLVAKVYSREASTNKLVAAVFDEDAPASVNESMLRQGLVRLAKRELAAGKARAGRAAGRAGADGSAAADELAFLARLGAAQDDARSGRVAMWRLGDVADSDDEPAPKPAGTGKAWGK